MSHALEPLIEALALEAERHPEELRVWAVAALASRLRLAVAVGEDAEPFRGYLDLDLDEPSYLVTLDLGDPDRSDAEVGDALDVVDGIESVGRAWLGMIEAMMGHYPERAPELRGALGRVLGAVRTSNSPPNA